MGLLTTRMVAFSASGGGTPAIELQKRFNEWAAQKSDIEITDIKLTANKFQFVLTVFYRPTDTEPKPTNDQKYVFNQ